LSPRNDSDGGLYMERQGSAVFTILVEVMFIWFLDLMIHLSVLRSQIQTCCRRLMLNHP
jgi:hypothetical protein